MRKHLTMEQRYAIYALLQTGISQKAMALAIGVNKSTISRELRRNCDLRSGRYVMDWVQCKADPRQKGKRRRCLFTEAAEEQGKEMLERKYRHRGVEKDSRGIIRDRVDISQREAVVERKERMVDLEIDTITDKGTREPP